MVPLREWNDRYNRDFGMIRDTPKVVKKYRITLKNQKIGIAPPQTVNYLLKPEHDGRGPYP